eukprot:5606579-Alexandrium_andersonii.AAC.1
MNEESEQPGMPEQDSHSVLGGEGGDGVTLSGKERSEGEDGSLFGDREALVPQGGSAQEQRAC